MSVLSYVHQLFNVGQCQAYIHTCKGLQSKWLRPAIIAFLGPDYGSCPILVIYHFGISGGLARLSFIYLQTHL
jgi:hypothetical protein